MTSSSIRGAVFLVAASLATGAATSASAQTAPPPMPDAPAPMAPPPPPPPPSEPGAMPEVRPSEAGPPPAPEAEPGLGSEDESNPIPDAPKFPKKRIVQKRERLSHIYQFGASAMPGTGYRVIFPYDDMQTCGDRSGDASKRVCTNYLPVFIDLQASFGVSNVLDVITDVRMGLKADFTNHKQVVLAPGIRYWVGPDETVKFYTTLQVAWDHTPQDQATVKTDDLALRNSNGMMIDLVKNFGLFVQLGETIGFRRWLRFELDGGAGVQLRVP